MTKKDTSYFSNYEWEDPLRLAESLFRLQNDFNQVAERFKEEQVQNSIVFFGSARIYDEKDAQEHLASLEKLSSKQRAADPAFEKKLSKARRSAYMAQFYTAAEELAFKLTQWALNLSTEQQQFLVCSGGGPGIMEASNKGSHRAGGRSIGLAIEIPYEQDSNRFISPELQFSFNTFLLRKFWFFYFAKAMIIFPGGLGTLDEFFEVMTLIKTGKINFNLPIVLFGTEYWKSLLDFDVLIQHGTAKKRELDIIKYSDCVDETYQYITKTLEEEYLKSR